jgi:hypothetical protein
LQRCALPSAARFATRELEQGSGFHLCRLGSFSSDDARAVYILFMRAASAFMVRLSKTTQLTLYFYSHADVSFCSSGRENDNIRAEFPPRFASPENCSGTFQKKIMHKIRRRWRPGTT